MATEKKAKVQPAKKAVAPAKKVAAAQAVETSGLQVKAKRKVVVGVVVSDKMAKTIVVKVDRRVRHALYKKYVMKTQRFKAHDETNQARVGDQVVLVETRPMSRDKRWALQTIVRRAGQAPEVNV